MRAKDLQYPLVYFFHGVDEIFATGEWVHGGLPIHADSFTILILAAVAQRERKLTSDRTKAALAAAKARGVKLGNPNGAQAIRRSGKGTTAALKAVREGATSRAAEYAETVADIQSSGASSLGAIAREMNERGIVTPRGGKWHPSSVRNLLQRLG